MVQAYRLYHPSGYSPEQSPENTFPDVAHPQGAKYTTVPKRGTAGLGTRNDYIVSSVGTTESPGCDSGTYLHVLIAQYHWY